MEGNRIILDFKNQPTKAIRHFQIEHAKIQGALAYEENQMEELLGRPMNEIEDIEFLLSHRKEFTRMGDLDRIMDGIQLQRRKETAISAEK